ncbi:MAG: hypothetical protein CL677_06910 [Bdellovibrionaceae bacterium]|nr:hypothetical protein [Pseudobdellovibrionaceae bacterium]|tara:strand:- start:21060 stop:21566 length:507 start_codon:yes stop_codon:yes gene_type:complete
MATRTLIILFFLITSPFAIGETKKQCTENERETRNCYLKYGPYTLRLSQEKIILDDSVRHRIFDFPYKDNPSWSDIQIEKINHRYVLNIKLWRVNLDAADVQSLHWVVMEVTSGNLIPITDQVIQKRRETELKDSPGFINDPLTYHAIKWDRKKKKLRWYAGRKSELF